MITSHQNLLIKRIKKLRQKKYRLRENACFVEGLRPVGMAIESGWDVVQLVWCDALLTSEYGRELVEKHPNAVELSDDLFVSIAERDNPTGIGAIVNTQIKTLEEFTAGRQSTQKVGIALCGVSDPGNLGTILRTVDAAVGNDGIVILVGNTVDPFHPAVIKASMGAVFCVPIVRETMDGVQAWVQANEIQTVATSAKAAVDFREVVYNAPVLLMMGSEREGLTGEIVETADHAVMIPMSGTSSSLNLAVATGVLLYQIIGRNL